MKCIPGGAKSETNSSAIDSRDEWDRTGGIGVLSRCSTLMSKIGPTWAEVHAATQEEKMARNQAVTWEEIVSTQLPGDEEDSESAADPPFENAHIEEEEYEEDVVIESVTEEELEEPVAGKPPTLENLTKSP